MWIFSSIIRGKKFTIKMDQILQKKNKWKNGLNGGISTADNTNLRFQRITLIRGFNWLD